MKRRKFIQAIALVPATATTVLAQTPPPAALQGRGAGPGPAAGAPPQAPVDPVTYAGADEVGETVASFFTATQFAALERLGRLFVPAAGAAPGAVESHAAQFLDFYVGRSPAERQSLYRAGLDGLNARARKRFDRFFGETDDKQADAVVMEFLSRPWSYEPADPIEAFVRTAMRDLRRATQNSSAYSATLPTRPTTNWLRPL
jgi:hypothetical protein